MESQTQQNKQTDKLVIDLSDGKLLFWIGCLMLSALVFGTFLGYVLTSISYGQAFKDGEIHICTNEEIQYQYAIAELSRCQNERVEYYVPKVTAENITLLTNRAFR